LRMYSKEDYLGPTMGDNYLCEPVGTLCDLSHNSGGFFQERQVRAEMI